MIPKYSELYNPVLEYLDEGTTRALKEIRDHIVIIYQLTEEELQERTNGGKLLYKDRIDWAVKYLFQAGLLERMSRGCYHITNLGRSTLQDHPNGITNKTLLQFESFRLFVQRGTAQNSTPVQEDISSLSPIEKIEESIAIINDSLASELLGSILDNEPTFFEHLVVDLLMKMGYGRLQHGSSLVTPPTNDGGIDGIINEDKLGLSKIYMQAKRYATHNKVGGPEMQQFIGAMSGKVTKGVFITTSDFTEQAKLHAQSSNVNIALINGKKLTELMIEFNLGVTVERTYDVKTINSDYFNEQM